MEIYGEYNKDINTPLADKDIIEEFLNIVKYTMEGRAIELQSTYEECLAEEQELRRRTSKIHGEIT